MIRRITIVRKICVEYIWSHVESVKIRLSFCAMILCIENRGEQDGTNIRDPSFDRIILQNKGLYSRFADVKIDNQKETTSHITNDMITKNYYISEKLGIHMQRFELNFD